METAKQIAFQVNAVRDDLTLRNARLYFCFFGALEHILFASIS